MMLALKVGKDLGTALSSTSADQKRINKTASSVRDAPIGVSPLRNRPMFPTTIR